MKTLIALTTLVALASRSIGSPIASDDASSESVQIRHQLETRQADSISVPLEKRRGGGGRGSGGGSSGGSSGSSGGSTGGSRGSGSTGGSSTGGATGGTRGVTSSSSSSPSYGGGRYYAGGSTSAYSPGIARGGITPFLIGGAGLGILAATWPHGAYVYPFDTRYNRHNDTSNQNQNQTLPVECLCDPYSSCGCEDTHNATFVDSFFYPNGTSMNETVARIQNVNGTDTVVLNGSLPNGTDADTDAAFGGSILSSRAMVDAVLAAGLATGFMLL